MLIGWPSRAGMNLKSEMNKKMNTKNTLVQIIMNNVGKATITVCVCVAWQSIKENILFFIFGHSKCSVLVL